MDKKVRYVSPLKSTHIHVDVGAHTSMFKVRDRDNSRCTLGSFWPGSKASTNQGHSVWRSIHRVKFFMSLSVEKPFVLSA
jgi:hypothetical protein